MKRVSYYILTIICLTGMMFASCSGSDDSVLTGVDLKTLIRYKWVDNSGLSADPKENVTIYFGEDNKCLVVHYIEPDYEPGILVPREVYPTRFNAKGDLITIDYSEFSDTRLVMEKDCLVGTNSRYIKENMSQKENVWLLGQFNSLDFGSDNSMAGSFMGIKEIRSDYYYDVAFGSPQIDAQNQLTYYKGMSNMNIRYSYTSGNIKSVQSSQYFKCICSYNVSNGLISSFSKTIIKGYDNYTLRFLIKYDDSRRISQIEQIDVDDTNVDNPLIYQYNFEWSEDGDLSCINLSVGGEGMMSDVRVYRYEYLSAIATLPALYVNDNVLTSPVMLSLDPILLMEGYYGNSISKHILRTVSSYNVGSEKPVSTYNFTYSLGKDDRILSFVQEYLTYNEADNVSRNKFTITWK